jgi:kynureninase
MGMIVDGREPDIIRVAPTALYTTFEDVEVLADALSELAKKISPGRST